MPENDNTFKNSMLEVRVGRQAIFDRNLDVHAYELLYRCCGESTQQFSGDYASANTLLNTFMEVGLDKIAGDKPVFVNLTQRFFTELDPISIPKNRVVLEILEDIPVNQQLIAKIIKLKSAGYKLALDDYVFEKKWQPILGLVDIIKVDVLATPNATLIKGMPALKKYPAALLAEKVETIEEFEQYMDLGFDLFQGFFLERPQIVKGKRMQENQAVVLRLLAKLNNPDIEISALEELINQDPGLSYKILRYINSAAFGVSRNVESIRQGVIYMGLAQLRSWASLFAMAKIDNKPDILVNTGLLRGNLCKQLSEYIDDADPDTAYTVGLFSILDALMDTQIEDIIGSLAVSSEISDALINNQGVYGQLLALAKAAEKNQWEQDPLPQISAHQLNMAFIKSTEKTFEQVGAIKS